MSSGVLYPSHANINSQRQVPTPGNLAQSHLLRSKTANLPCVMSILGEECKPEREETWGDFVGQAEGLEDKMKEEKVVNGDDI